MAWWRRKPEPPRDDLVTRLEAIERELLQLRHIEAEWGDMYDKFAHLLKRWQKRDRDEARGEATPAPNGPEAAPLNPMALRLLARGERH